MIALVALAVGGFLAHKRDRYLKTLPRDILESEYDVKLVQTKPLKFVDAQTSMKNARVVFGATVRNVGPYIAKALQNIERCGLMFSEFALVIYENDSVDDTRDILKSNSKPNYHYIFEDNVKESRRTMRLERGRNLILDKVKSLDFTHMVLLDLDDVNDSGKFVDTLATCFAVDGWDMLSATQTTGYYDLWALRKKGDVDFDLAVKLRQQWYNMNRNDQYANRYKHVYEPGQFLEVDSAFGGAAIYKITPHLFACSYSGEYSNGWEKCEHVDFNRCLKSKGAQLYINTSFLTS